MNEKLQEGIATVAICSLVIGAFFAGWVLSPQTRTETVTITTPRSTTTTITQTSIDLRSFQMDSEMNLNVRNCSTLAAYFAEFNNPVIVANYEYYIYRQPTATLGTLPNFSDIAGNILSNVVVRTSSYPLYNQTTYFWQANVGNWSWMNCP